MTDLTLLDLERQYFRAVNYLNRKARGDRMLVDPYMTKYGAIERLKTASSAPFVLMRVRAMQMLERWQ